MPLTATTSMATRLWETFTSTYKISKYKSSVLFIICESVKLCFKSAISFAVGQLEKPQGKELVLDYIIERKRMDDLVGSCIDGRFKEQKVCWKFCIFKKMYTTVSMYCYIWHDIIGFHPT